jgi:hypothetical protein
VAAATRRATARRVRARAMAAGRSGGAGRERRQLCQLGFDVKMMRVEVCVWVVDGMRWRHK